mmetsp:Transcript_47914/g.113876  ORF Transcript_47914/g.113876 Transcript_47914/m.113876 type:complete len:578 (-) Transcript_47914:41-1774(-)
MATRTEKPLPWDFSGAGRQSSVGLQRLRGQVTGGSKAQIAQAQIAAPASLSGSAALAAAGLAHAQQALQQQQQQRIVSLEIEDPSVPEEPVTKSRSVSAAPQTLRPSVAFVASGPSGDRSQMRSTGRMFASHAGSSEAPEAGRYRPGLDLVTRRTSTVDFRERPKHMRRVPTPEVSIASQQGLGGTSEMASRSSSPHTGDRSSVSIHKVDQMRLQTKRPDLVDSINRNARTSPIKMTELSEVSRDKDEQYKLLSTTQRYGEVHFDKCIARKSFVKENFFQPGKYTVQLPSPAGAVTFASSSRFPDEEEVKPKKQGSPSAVRDLSLARDSVWQRAKIKNLQDFSKSPPRFPSPSRSGQHSGDEDDGFEQSHDRAMNQDLDRSRQSIERQPKAGQGMRKTLPRHVGSFGHRTFQSDLSLMTMHGFVGSETSVQLDPSAFEDAPVGARRDKHLLPFDRTRGRPSDENRPANASSLRKPRWCLPPDFSRVAPQSGFASRAGIGGARVLPCNRMYKAVAGWDVAALDEDTEAEPLHKVKPQSRPPSRQLEAVQATVTPGSGLRQAASAPTLPIGRPGTSPCA